MTAGSSLVATLLAHGVTQAFCAPGDGHLAVLEALRRERRRIRPVGNRHESGATFAAEAYGKIARRPSSAMRSRRPSATTGRRWCTSGPTCGIPAAEPLPW